MSWMLGISKTPGSEPVHHIPIRQHAYLVLLKGVLAVTSTPPAHDTLTSELGQISITSSGAKLEAVDHILAILSGQENSAPGADPRTAPYELQPRVGERSEVMFLRHGDIISLPQAQAVGSFICTWNESESEVQVNSSAAEVGKIKKITNDDGMVENPDEETEDEDLDNTVTAVEATQSKSQQQPRATPQLSNQRSIVVQETPTIARTTGVTEYPVHMDVNQPNLGGIMPTEQAEAEQYPSADARQHSQNGVQDDAVQTVISVLLQTPHAMVEDTSEETPVKTRHPKILISRKRPSPAVEEPALDGSDTESISQSRKRTKIVPSDSDTQDSRLSTIAVDTSPATGPASKGRKRRSVLKKTEETVEASPRSQRSQRSISAAASELYEGDTPRVATSNSALTEKTQAAKFLKKQGGSLIDSVKEPFNILCVRDGDLHKTPKVLHAIATGTPIVTDKWLTDSAKAGHFLSVDAYQPSAPKKEKEWGFALKNILGQPQTPFAGYTIHFTTSLQSTYKPFTEIEQVCKAAGAKVTKKKMDKSENIIVLAMDEGDKEAERLMQDGVVCFNRDLVPLSIFRGTLDLDSDEFRITEVTTKEAKKTRGKKS